MDKYKLILEHIKERMEKDEKVYANTSEQYRQKGLNDGGVLYAGLYAMDEGKRFQSTFVVHLIETALEEAEVH